MSEGIEHPDRNEIASKFYETADNTRDLLREIERLQDDVDRLRDDIARLNW